MHKEISYQQMEEIAFQKAKIISICQEKTDAYRLYREHWKRWNELCKEHDKEKIFLYLTIKLFKKINGGQGENGKSC